MCFSFGRFETAHDGSCLLLRRLGGSRSLGAGPLTRHPAGHVALPAAAHRQDHRPDVAGDRRTGRNVGAVGDLDRRGKYGVAADEGVRPNGACRLAYAVVVGEDHAGADVGALADHGVAEVAQVRRLGARPDAGVLGLDEGADLAAGTQCRTGPQVGERADVGAWRRSRSARPGYA